MQYNHIRNFVKNKMFVLPVFEDRVDSDLKEFDETLTQYIGESLYEDFKGKRGQSVLLYGGERYSRLLLVGVGQEKKLNLLSWKKIVGSMVIMVQNKKLDSLTFVIPDRLSQLFDLKQLGQATVISAGMAEYTFDEHKKEDTRTKAILEFNIMSNLTSTNKKKFDQGMEIGSKVVAGINLTRHLGNTPPSIMTPTLLASESERAFKNKKNVKVTILHKEEIEKYGMGCLLGVSRGSKEEPKFIIIEYFGTDKNKKPTVLVGKGITFDSGGLSLKPSNSMSDMKFDMLGGATVIGIISSAVSLGLKKNIIGLIPTCENMPSGESYRPDDILIAMNGLSVEVQNTDAEGRLILADAFSYVGEKYKPKEVIDFATLTGACVVALGNERSGLFTKDDNLSERILSSAQNVGEQLWRLPLGEEYREAMKSEVADIKNIGGVPSAGYGGASTAAAFLETFTEDPKTGEALFPWAHIDLSSAYFTGSGKSYIRGGATGFVVETMIEFLKK